MKYCQRFALSALFSMLSVTVSANLQQDALSRLNQLDATQQQRQVQQQQAQASQFQSSAEVRVETGSQENLTLSNFEMPC